MGSFQLLRLCVLLLSMLAATVSHAHITTHSTLLLDVNQSELVLELDLPLNELALALPAFTGTEADFAAQSTARAQLQQYLEQHVSLTVDGLPAIAPTTDSIERADLHDTAYARVRQRFALPAEAPKDTLDLRYDVITATVINHQTFTTLRNDFRQGISPENAQALDVLHFQNKQLLLKREEASLWRGFRALFMQGVSHISTGSDHLLFLFCLLLTMPLRPFAGRWQPARNNRQSLLDIAKVVTAFTLGHALTLGLLVIGKTELPSQPVEILVACSVMVSALHALKPLFKTSVALIAIGFGLIHGMAFSGVLLEMHLDKDAMLVCLLAFNLGIESAQLAIVILVTPALLFLAQQRTRLYTGIRIVGACFAFLAALNWIVERSFNMSSPISPLFDMGGWSGLAAYGLVCLIALYAVVRKAGINQ